MYIIYLWKKLFCKSGYAILGVSLFVILSTGVVYANPYSLNVNDGTIDDWGEVPVFQSDQAGDAPSADVDILEARVAVGPTIDSVSHVYFLLKTAGNPALEGQHKAVVASIDCDGNGIDQEPHDRLIAYVRTDDQIFIMRGDQSELFIRRGNDGQGVGDSLEWRVAIKNLPPDEKDLNTNCRGNVKLRFLTVDVSEYYESPSTPSTGIVLDEITELIDWYIPEESPSTAGGCSG